MPSKQKIKEGYQKQHTRLQQYKHRYNTRHRPVQQTTATEQPFNKYTRQQKRMLALKKQKKRQGTAPKEEEELSLKEEEESKNG